MTVKTDDTTSGSRKGRGFARAVKSGPGTNGLIVINFVYFLKIKNRDEMEKRTETGLVMGHAYGVTAVKKVSRITINAIVTLV